MSTSTDQVLDNPDLLALIFDYLEPQDLLINGQRVRQSWKFVISSTTLFQQKLFFAPKAHQRRAVLNPLLVRVFKGWFSLVGRRITDIYDYSTNAHLFLNPELQRTAVMRADASWRNMLPVQPPPTELEVLKLNPSRLARNSNLHPAELAIKNFELGVRMGTLYDLSWRAANVPNGGFALLWNMFPLGQYPMPLNPLGGLPEWEHEGPRFQDLLFGALDNHFHQSDKVTLVMDLSMPLERMPNFTNSQHKSWGYEEMELILDGIDMSRAAHIAQVCHFDCQWNQKNGKELNNAEIGTSGSQVRLTDSTRQTTGILT